jgi:hypothetical protein
MWREVTCRIGAPPSSPNVKTNDVEKTQEPEVVIRCDALHLNFANAEDIEGNTLGQGKVSDLLDVTCSIHPESTKPCAVQMIPAMPSWSSTTVELSAPTSPYASPMSDPSI